MKVGEISGLPPDQRAVESDYLMAHDLNLIEPIKRQLDAGTPPADIRAKVESQLLPVTEYLANRGITDPAEVRLELEGLVKSVVEKLEAPRQATASRAPASQVSEARGTEDMPRSEAVSLIKAEIEKFANDTGVDMNVKQVVDGAEGDIELTDMFARETGKGAGTKVMEKFVELADRHGLNIYTTPSEPRNVEFYSRFGFERPPGKPRYTGLPLVRYPRLDINDTSDARSPDGTGTQTTGQDTVRPVESAGDARSLYVAARRRFERDGGVRYHGSGSNSDDEGLRSVKQRFTPSTEYAALLAEHGFPAVTLNELEATPENATTFHAAISASKASKYGAAVYVYPLEEYQGFRLFTTDDGKNGFAIKPDGDIVSVFSSGGHKVFSMLALATQEGGTKLDAFDTILPKLYAAAGFVETGREPWNEDYKPEGWNYETFAPFNNGRPDVVFMEYRGADESASIAPLEGAPAVSGGGPIPELVDAAEKYAEENGIPYTRQGEYVEVDEGRARRIAVAYSNMAHAPNDPKVKEAYDDLIRQTRAQYDALTKAGFTFYFYDNTNDPYRGNPWAALRDLRQNKRMAVYATGAGFGSGYTPTLDTSDHPFLQDSGLQWPYGSPDGPPQPVRINDLFRAVHDAFGHGLEGAGFRARGEENAWQSHVRLFTGPAIGAMTSGTRGQNSWLNYGPHGDSNRTAPVDKTVFADQKAGLMPEWTWTEGKSPDYGDVAASASSGEDDVSSAFGLPMFDARLPVEGKVKIKSVAQAMTDYHMQTEGRPYYPESNPEDYATVRDHITAELTEQLRRPNSGVGWYSKDVALALDLARRAYPTLADPVHRDLYLTFAGIFSNGQDPDAAFFSAALAYEAFLATGEIVPLRTAASAALGLDHAVNSDTGKPVGWTRRNDHNEQQLTFLKNLVEREGSLEAALKWMIEPQKRSDINAAMTEDGLYKKGRYKTVEALAGPDAPGVMAFGEKLGRYTMGLHGFDAEAGDVVIDQWFIRTYRRLVGRLMEGPIDTVTGIVGGPNDQDRRIIRKLVGELVSSSGLNTGDTQAALWFFEKRLWASQGIDTNEGTNSSGARKLLRSKGLDDGTGSDGADRQTGQGQAVAADAGSGEEAGAVSASPSPKSPVDTPEFKAWFGDSKVVDEEGEPLVMYHGSPDDFDAFDPGKINPSDPDARVNGFWFTSKKEDAARWAKFPYGRPNTKDGGTTFAVYLSIKNPATRADIHAAAKAIEARGEFYTQDNIRAELIERGFDGYHHVAAKRPSSSEIAEFEKTGRLDLGKGRYLKRAEDGSVDLFDDAVGGHVTGGWETVGEYLSEHEQDTWVAFSPTQIKSVFNRGTFDPNNPSISAASAPPRIKGARHAYIHERVRPAGGIKHVVTVNGQPVKEIAQNFKKALDGLTVQVGRFNQGHSDAEGIYKWQQSVARVRSENDLTTLFHEGAHHLHSLLGKPLDALIDKHIAEIEHIALHYYGGGGIVSAKDKLLVRREGFAHFFQVFVNNPMLTDVIAKGFAPEFRALLDQLEPGLRAKLGEVVKAVDMHVTTKSSLQLAREHVVMPEGDGPVARLEKAWRDGNAMHVIGDSVERGYMGIVSSEYPLLKTINKLKAASENNFRRAYERGQITKKQLQEAIDRLDLKGKRDTVKMYWAAKNASMRAAEFLANGVRAYHNLTGPPVSKGLKQIMLEVTRGATGQKFEQVKHDFSTYLAHRRIRSERKNYQATMDWLRNGRVGPPPTIMRTQEPDSSMREGDTNQAIADLDRLYPHFSKSADDIYQMLRAMVHYRRAAGDYTQEEADYLLAFEDYVPVHRVMDKDRRLSGAGDSVLGKTNGIQVFKGSGRDISSPLHAIEQTIHQQLAVSMRNEMALSIVNLALDVGQGSGAVVEKIPDTQMKGTRVNLSEILKASGHVDITAAGVEVQGADINDLRELADELLDGTETATIWRAGEINEKREHIIYVRRNGKREAYKLNDPEWADDLYRTLTDLAPPQRDLIVRILSVPARALRLGVVTEPIWQLANMMRDATVRMILHPGIPFLKARRGLKNKLYAAEMRKLYNLSATTIAGREIAALDKRKFGLEQSRLQKLGINVREVPGVGQAMDLVRSYYNSEALGRESVFVRAYERALKDGLSPDDALMEAGFTSSDYMNYGRGGSLTAALRSIIPFLGAGINGIDKGIRAAFAGPALPGVMRKKLQPWLNRTLNAEGPKTSLPLSKGEWESIKYAMKVQTAMASLAIADVLLASLYWGDEEYDNFDPYMKGTRWLMKLGPGQWIGVPKPFQFAFYGTFAGYALDAAFKGDSTAMMNFLESQLYVTMVPYENPGIALGYEILANKDFFSGRDIVPPHLAAKPWRMQSDIYTSELGKAIGKVTGLSPMVIDHTIKSSFATWGRSAIALSNLTDETRPEQGLEDFAFTRYFIKNGSRSTIVKPAFWNLVGRSTGALTGSYDAYRDLMDAGAVGQAERFLADATDDERAYAHLNYYQKVEAKKLHPLRNAADLVTVLSSMRKEITAGNFKMDGGDGERLVLSPTVQRQLNDRISALSIREMRNALIITNQPGFGGKRVMPTLSIFKEIEAIDGRVARELKERLGSKVYSFDAVRKIWPIARTEILLHGEKAQLTPLVSQARAAGRKYFTEGDAVQ
jgi:GNAT superfamily N-acetyltransferase